MTPDRIEQFERVRVTNNPNWLPDQKPRHPRSRRRQSLEKECGKRPLLLPQVGNCPLRQMRRRNGHYRLSRDPTGPLLEVYDSRRLQSPALLLAPEVGRVAPAPACSFIPNENKPCQLPPPSKPWRKSTITCPATRLFVSSVTSPSNASITTCNYAHDMSADAYRERFGIPRTRSLTSAASRARSSILMTPERIEEFTRLHAAQDMLRTCAAGGPSPGLPPSSIACRKKIECGVPSSTILSSYLAPHAAPPSRPPAYLERHRFFA